MLQNATADGKKASTFEYMAIQAQLYIQVLIGIPMDQEEGLHNNEMIQGNEDARSENWGWHLP